MTTDRPSPGRHDLYPDVSASGGLVPALEDAACDSSADIGSVGANEDRPFWSATVRTDRGVIRVDAAVAERAFSIVIADRRTEWSTGVATELLEVVQVIDAWRSGARLQELHDRFPFMTHSRLAQAYEHGNAHEVAWDILLAGDYPVARPLLSALRAHGRLGRLSAAVSHNNLVYIFLDPHDRSSGRVQILIARDGQFHLSTTLSDERRTVTSIGAAVEAAADMVPTV